MPQSPCYLIKNYLERRPARAQKSLSNGLRGIYVLFQEGKPRPKNGKFFDVVYIGMAGLGEKGGVKGRLADHIRDKAGLWSHFSVFEVWDNISKDQIAELEGLFRQIFGLDMRALSLSRQKTYKPLLAIRRKNL